MKNDFKKIELLAPAQNKEYGITAINCGADAVYIGAESFGARKSAGNSLEDIKELVEHARKYKAKVYVTVNTILNDTEIKQAEALIHSLYDIGADAVIIQDMGLLECDLPSIPLFASTQTHNNSLEKVDFLEKVGFQRVILARELSLEQIQEIKANTNVELECFVHGALCVGYSGQCYLSHAIGGRSGNRGECAQPCRKKYKLVDSDGNIISDYTHLLSLKDLNFSNRLKELIEAGITSFKIEGRLKDENYVKNAVSFYRRELDKILEEKGFIKSSSGIVISDFIPDPDKTFNRGYSEYVINGRKKDMASFDTPKSKGEYIGSVVKAEKNRFLIDGNKRLNNGDGICFLDRNKELKGTNINVIKDNFIYPQNIDGIAEGCKIYRNYDHEFLKQLEKTEFKRKIGIDIKVFENEKNIIFEAVDEDGISEQISLRNIFEPAQNKNKALENIEKQLNKLGETIYTAEKTQIKLTEIPFIPIKDLNKIRRNLIEKLDKKRSGSIEKSKFARVKNDYTYFEKELDYKANIHNSKAETFYGRHGAKVNEYAPESGIKTEGKVVMTTKHCLRYSFGLCNKDNKETTDKNLFLIDEHGKKYTLNFNCKNCEMEIVF